VPRARIVLILPLLLLGLLLAACAAGRKPTPAASPTPAATLSAPALATPTGPITLTYWETDTDDAGVLLDELSAAFMKINPDITVKRVHYSYDDFRTEFRQQALNGKPPELVRAAGEFAGPFSELGIVHQVDLIFARDFLDQYFAGALAGVTVKGKLWGLPDNFGNQLLLLYNKALVNAVPANTDAWIGQLKSLTSPITSTVTGPITATIDATITNTITGTVGLVYPLNESYWLIPWLGGFGGWPLDAADRPALDTLEMADALQFVHDLKFVDHVVPDQTDYDTAFGLFRQGRAGYIIDGMWNLDRYQGLGIDVGVAPFPRVSASGLAPVPMATGRYWFISQKADGARLDAAARFVEFMTSTEAQQQWLEKMHRLPSDKEAARSELITKDPILSGAMAQLRVARGVPPALEMACAWQGIDKYLPRVMADSITPEDAAPAMQTIADACVDDMTISPTPTPTPGK